jgi:hypothetical protein
MELHDFDLELPPLSPARIHAQQHAGPVLALGATSAGVDFEIGVIAVGFSRQQRFYLRRARGMQRLVQRRLSVLNDLGIALGLPEFDQLDIVANGRFELPDVLDLHVEFIALPHDGARLLGVRPEVGVFGTGSEVV